MVRSLGLAIVVLTHAAKVFGQHYVVERLPSTINSAYEEIKPVFSRSGDSLFFVRDYAPENVGGKFSGEDIWLATYSEEEGWGEATNDFGYNNKPGPDIMVG